VALELGLLELDRDDRGESFPDVVALEVGVLLLQEPLGPGVPVHHVGEGLLEALLVSATLVRVDRVGERVDRLGEAGVPLHRHLDLGVLALPFEVDDPVVERVLPVVQELDEVGKPALGLVDLAHLLAATLVRQGDLDPAGQVSELAEALGEHLSLELGLLEDARVRPERDDRARLLGGLPLLELLLTLPSGVGLGPGIAVPGDLDLQALG
jgi:hypothetical protein